MRDDFTTTLDAAAAYERWHGPTIPHPLDMEPPSRAELAAEGCEVCGGDGWLGRPCPRCGTVA